jgi:hypothetical protein
MSQPIWITPAGNLGAFTSNSVVSYQLSATAVLPATTITYNLISGTLPNGLSLSLSGLIFGTTDTTITNTTYTFVVRITDNLQNIRDRTFSIQVSGIDAPTFVTEAGTILITEDSVWVEYPIQYQVPVPNTDVLVALVQGDLPPGLEINEFGLIRGYPKPPIVNVSLGTVVNAVIATINNTLVSYSTVGFRPGRPIIFTGSIIGGINQGQTYYVKQVIDGTTFTISTTVDGPTLTLNNDVGYMDATLPNVSVGQPTIQTYEFTLRLITDFGTALESYAITVVNQNASISIGGPGKPFNTRVPTILNTRPLSYDITSNEVDYSFYLFPPNSEGRTYNPTQLANIGKVLSDNKFNFRILAKDFDNNQIEFIFANLPLGLQGDPTTGWITGNPIIADNTLSEFSFSVAVRKVSNPSVESPFFNFSFRVSNDVNGEIVWISPESLGTIFNGNVSTITLSALSDVNLEYTFVSGNLPPNLTLQSSGDLVGTVAFQPNSTLTPANASTEYSFTVRAYSPDFPIVSSEKTFTLTVKQLFAYPTDNVYIKCTPSVENRELLKTLLNDNSLIPEDYLYRPNDPNFGKAKSIIYDHIYGIYSSAFEDYVAAVTKNHYWRQLTLGELKTALARNEQTGDVIYEVVYSSVIDNLVNIFDESVSKEIFWPRFIPLDLGPWYTSSTDIFTSYIGQDNQTQFYTSLTPGFARLLYPNSLPNMREQVKDELGEEVNTNLFPLWMTSQQLDGNTLGFTPAWVICYTKPGYSGIVKNNIENNWKNPVGQIQKLNQINFKIDRFTVDKSTTYNFDTNLFPPAWISLPSATPVPDPIDSKDFYVLFPRPTILPDDTQYPR